MTFSEFLSGETAPMREKILATLGGFEAATVRVQHVKAGDFIMYQHNERSDIYVLLEGRISVISQHEQFNSYDEYLPITVFGEQEALAALPAIRADVRAKTNSRFLVVSERDYLLWVQSDVEIMQRRVGYALNKLIQYGIQERESLFLSNSERLQSYLIDYYNRHPKENEPGVVTVRQQRGIIAEEIGCSLRTVNRNVQKLHENGQIGLARGKITLTETQYKDLKVTVTGRGSRVQK